MTEREIAFEEWCRFAVRRMCYWKEEDLKKSKDFRSGIEQACSDMCVYFRRRKSDDSTPYLERLAIEYAMNKCGMVWNNNRTRLDFYEHFEDYIKQRVIKVISDVTGE